MIEKKGRKKKELDLKKETLKTKIDAARETLKTNLLKIKDAKKQQTVENIITKIQDLNTKAVNNLSESLNKINDAILRIESNANDASTKGINVTTTLDAIKKAKLAVEDAKSAAVLQAGKVYTVNITTETALKGTVTTAKESLTTDIKALRDKVQAARNATKDAAVALAQTPGINATGSVTTNNQVEVDSKNSTN